MGRVFNPLRSTRSTKQPEQFKVETVRIVHETGAAICVELKESVGLVWFPLSQVHSIHRSDPPVLYVTPWIAKQKGLY